LDAHSRWKKYVIQQIRARPERTKSKKRAREGFHIKAREGFHIKLREEGVKSRWGLGVVVAAVV